MNNNLQTSDNNNNINNNSCSSSVMISTRSTIESRIELEATLTPIIMIQNHSDLSLLSDFNNGNYSSLRS